jgi:hypothetical protein
LVHHIIMSSPIISTVVSSERIAGKGINGTCPLQTA